MSLPSQEYLKSRIDYNPETGEAKWKPVDETYGPKWKQFNTTRAGELLPTKEIRILGGKISTSKVLYCLHHGKAPVGKIKFLDGDNTNLRISNMDGYGQQLNKDTSFLPTNSNIPSEVTDLLSYDKESGILYWNTRPDSPAFNSRYAGTEAGYISSRGYIKISIYNRDFSAHRLAWYLYYGVDPGHHLIDHIDETPTNNSILNLRLGTSSLNVSAAIKKAKGYYERNNKFWAQIKINGKNKSLGSFSTPEEATAVYNAAVSSYRAPYKFTESEQQLLDKLHSTYPNCSADLQQQCHDIHVKAITHYVDAAIVQTPNLEYNSSP